MTFLNIDWGKTLKEKIKTFFVLMLIVLAFVAFYLVPWSKIF